jgi:predicted phage tail protein
MVGTRVTAAIGNGEARDLQVAPTTAESKRIAGLVGPTLVALSASEALNYRIWNDNLAPVTYLNGALLFVGGLSIVRVHNRWTRGWPLLTTLVGWSAMALGLVRMFAPQARQPRRNAATDGLLLAMFASGAVLTFQAGRPAVHRR